MKLLFDTNILIYHFNNQLTELGTALLREGIAGEGIYSVISTALAVTHRWTFRHRNYIKVTS